MSREFDLLQEFIESTPTGGQYLKIEEGTYDIRLLPHPDLERNGEKFRWFTNEIAYWFGDNDSRQKLVCPSTFGEESPIPEIEREATPEVKAIMKDRKLFQRSESYLFPVLLLKVDDDDVENFDIVGVKILQCTRALAKELSDIIASKHYKNLGEYGDSIADLDEGHNITIVRKGKSLDTKYTVNVWRGSTPVDESWLDELPDIQKTLDDQYVDYEEMRDKIEEYLYSAAEMIPARGARGRGRGKDEAPARGRRPKQEPDEERGPEEESPRSRRRKAAPKEEAEEETKKPTRRGRPPAAAKEAPKEEKKPARRARKPAATAEKKEPVKKPARRGRPPAAAKKEAEAKTEKPKRGRPVRKKLP